MVERIELIRGDITKIDADAIVNAANRSLLGGGGVDGAIHKAAGTGLLEACRLLGGCNTGEAKITPGYNLPARHVIHTAGPVWGASVHEAEKLLAGCYRESLLKATLHDCKSIAFPNISTGVYGFPKQPAAEIAIREVKRYLATNAVPIKVIFVCFDAENFAIYQEFLNQ